VAYLLRLKNNKAPGQDLVQSEIIKYAGPKWVKHLYQLMTKIWITETIPDDWNPSIICPIHTKGDVMVCSNYRGISLLCTAYKIFSNILFNRIAPFMEETIGDFQCGFRKGRSTVDQIFTLCQIFEKRIEFGIETSLLISELHMTV
jgi:sorting nexin-29